MFILSFRNIIIIIMYIKQEFIFSFKECYKIDWRSDSLFGVSNKRLGW